jgi:hypothetical protein
MAIVYNFLCVNRYSGFGVQMFKVNPIQCPFDAFSQLIMTKHYWSFDNNIWTYIDSSFMSWKLLSNNYLVYLLGIPWTCVRFWTQVSLAPWRINQFGKHWACDYLIVVTNGFCLLKWNVTNCLSKLNLHVMSTENELV